MKKILFVLLAVAAIACTGCSGSSIIGKWGLIKEHFQEGVNTFESDELAIEFTENGKCLIYLAGELKEEPGVDFYSYDRSGKALYLNGEPVNVEKLTSTELVLVTVNRNGKFFFKRLK